MRPLRRSTEILNSKTPVFAQQSTEESEQEVVFCKTTYDLTKTTTSSKVKEPVLCVTPTRRVEDRRGHRHTTTFWTGQAQHQQR